jgi:hypothetical protein
VSPWRNGVLLPIVLIALIIASAGTGGFFVSTSLGLWWTIGENRVIAAGIAANGVRLDAQAEALKAFPLRMDSLLLEHVALRSRLDKLEERVPKFEVTANTLIEQERHLSAIDGRANGIETQIAALQAQITRLCAALDGISSASARKSGCR